jgi:hypothetical protein
MSTGGLGERDDEWDVWDESGAKHQFGPLGDTRCFLRVYHGLDASSHALQGRHYCNGHVEGSLSVWLYRVDDSYVCCVNAEYDVYHYTFTNEFVEDTYWVELSTDALENDCALAEVAGRILLFTEVEKRGGKDMGHIVESYL